uniref:fumarate hydratase C-terminal domain-containing protein n=1 Tax=Treponema pedis TaxID=409322 RepID=UPI000463AF18
MSEQKKLKPPLKREDLKDIKAGDIVLLSGYIYTGRDAAHKRLCELLEKGERLPIDVRGAVMY